MYSLGFLFIRCIVGQCVIIELIEGAQIKILGCYTFIYILPAMRIIAHISWKRNQDYNNNIFILPLVCQGIPRE